MSQTNDLGDKVILSGQDWYKHVKEHEYWCLCQATDTQDHKGS